MKNTLFPSRRMLGALGLAGLMALGIGAGAQAPLSRELDEGAPMCTRTARDHLEVDGLCADGAAAAHLQSMGADASVIKCNQV